MDNRNLCSFPENKNLNFSFVLTSSETRQSFTMYTRRLNVMYNVPNNRSTTYFAGNFKPVCYLWLMEIRPMCMMDLEEHATAARLMLPCVTPKESAWIWFHHRCIVRLSGFCHSTFPGWHSCIWWNTVK